MKKIMLTGDRPTGKLHVGHYVGSLRRRVELQNTGDYYRGSLGLPCMRSGSCKVNFIYPVPDTGVM